MFGNQHKGIVDRSDIKKLTSALKDLQDIIPQRPQTKMFPAWAEDFFFFFLNSLLDPL